MAFPPRIPFATFYFYDLVRFGHNNMNLNP